MKNIMLFLACITIAGISCTSTIQPAAKVDGDSQPTAVIRQMTYKVTHSAEAVVVHTPYLNVRACAGVQCAIIGKLDEGQAVQVTQNCTVPDEAVYEWCELGVGGWVNTRYIAETK